MYVVNLGYGPEQVYRIFLDNGKKPKPAIENQNITKYPVVFTAFVYSVSLYGTKLQHFTGCKRAIYQKVQLVTCQ